MSDAAGVTSRVDKHLAPFSKAKVLGGGRDVAFSCVHRRWIYFGFFCFKHISSMTWWECFLVILLEDCRVGGALLCVWTFRLSARNAGCWPLVLEKQCCEVSWSDLCRGICSRCLLPITHQSWCWGEAPIANAETVLTEHKTSMWQAAHWVLKPMRQVHLLPFSWET